MPQKQPRNHAMENLQPMSETLPQTIKDYIITQANNDTYEAMQNTYSITTVLYCIRKKYFQQTLPKKPFDLKTSVNFYRGNLWDRNFTGLFKRNQIRSTYRCRNVPITISGKFDFIDENGVLTDLKCPSDLYYVERDGKPSEAYRKQVLFYCYTNAQTKGQVMYWNGNKCIIYPVEVTDENCRELIEELESKVMLLWSAFQTGKPPSKQACNPESYECRSMCDFSKECSEEGQTKL